MDIYFGPVARAHFERSPVTLIDIGARGGLQPNWKGARSHLKLVGFEPDPAEYARLAAGADPQRAVYINAAVGREAAELELNVGREGGTSSLLEPNLDFLRRFPRPERYEVVRKVRVTTDRLDALLPRHGVHGADFIKIDAQGGELAILQGARATLERSIFGVEVEVLFAPLYRGQPSFGDVDSFLSGLGFQLFDLRHSYWKRTAGARYGGPKGQLMFGDALYFRTEESIACILAQEPPESARPRLLRALTIALLYGYADYAIELFEAHRSLFDGPLAKEVAETLRSNVDISSRVPHFRGRGFLSHLFYRLHRTLFPTAGGWASGGRTIGNVD
jgi:FkbM family methyltransferase